MLYGMDRWAGERAKDRRRAAARNARIAEIADRWGPTVEDALAEAMGRYLQLRFPDPAGRPPIRVVINAEVPTQHAGSPRTVAWIVGRADAGPAPNTELPELAVVLVSRRERFGERVRFRIGDVEHPGSGDVGRWLEGRLDAWLVAALGRHR